MGSSEKAFESIKEAIKVAPDEFAVQNVDEQIKLWIDLSIKSEIVSFHKIYEQIKDYCIANNLDLNAVNRYLVITTTEAYRQKIYSNLQTPVDEKQNEKLIAGKAIISGDIASSLVEKAPFSPVLENQELTIEDKIAEVIALIEENRSTVKLKEADENLKTFIQDSISKARAELANNPKSPVVRFMSSLYKLIDNYCVLNGYKNPLLNLTIGDVDKNKMPIDLQEKLGLLASGKKNRKISNRADAYETEDPNVNRYDITALGNKALREKFKNYAKFFGLYKNSSDIEESMIGAGGSQTLNKAFLVAKKYYDGIPVSAYFSNPNLRMIATIGRNTGLEILEVPAHSDDNFFPNPKEVDDFLTKNPNCKIFIHTPIGNPNGVVSDREYTSELLEVLKKHDVILINDFAYLGVGDYEKSKQMCEELAKYQKRIDVIPMTKVFGNPALRCGAALTPNQELGKLFMPICQNFQPTESYAMQSKALAFWDFVRQEDRDELSALFKKRQENLINKLKQVNQARINEGKIPLFDPEKKIMGDASLYVYCPINEGFDPFDIIQETGMIGTPGVGFDSGEEGQKYIRFAVGAENIEE